MIASSKPFLRLPPGASRLLVLSSLALLASLALPGCKRGESQKAAPATASAPPPPVSVQTAPVTHVTVPRKLLLTGTLRGAKETELAADVNGKILKVLVDRGQHVKKGELLAQVDVQAARLALVEARVQVANTKTQEAINSVDCERYEQLKARGVVTSLEYDQVTAKCKTAPLNVEAAEARRRIAAKNVGDGAIRSPFTGVVTERYIEVGEYVQASSRVVSLAQVDGLRLEFSLPEQNFPDVKLGAEVLFKVSAYNETRFPGSVSHISGAVRPTRDVLIEAAVDNAGGKLLPGMFAEVELIIGQEKLVAVPKSAVFKDNGKQNVFVVNKGVLEQRVLQTAATVKDQVAVRRGVVMGEQVVTAQLETLSNGQKVD